MPTNPDAAPAGPCHLPESKRARRAALIAQLTQNEVIAEDPATLQSYAEAAYNDFKPASEWHRWICQQIAVTQFRINRVDRIERRLRDWAALRAIDWWEADQALAVANLGTRLRDEPARVVAELHQTPAGCRWLIERWHLLAQSRPADWTEPQRQLAAAMLGLASAPAGTLDVAAATQAAQLRAHADRLREADAIARGLVEADLSDDIGPEVRRLRRQENTLYARLRWLMAQLKVELPGRWVDPRFKPVYLESAAYVDPAFARPEPAADAAAAAPDETNPTPPAPAPDETNPPPPAPAAAPDPTPPPETPAVERVAADAAADPAAHRRRRVDPGRALARQRRSARRQA